MRWFCFALGVVIVVPFNATVLSASKSFEECLVELDIPAYPRLAAGARITGVTEVSFTVSPEGQTHDISVAGGHDLLKSAVRASISSSRFSQKCAGRQLTAIFRFVEGGLSEDTTRFHTKFLPPDEIRLIMVVKLAEPILDGRPLPGSKAPPDGDKARNRRP